VSPRVGVVIPCRLDSERLPGKVLADVAGAPLLAQLLARVESARVWDAVVLATTDRAVDDPIVEFGRGAGVDVFRGALDDVAGRLLGAAGASRLDWFLRVNGDSPCVDPALLNVAVERIAGEDVDFVTNLLPRRFPYGIAVEAVRTEVYRSLVPRLDAEAARERPMSILYESEVRTSRIEREGPDLSRVRLAVDSPDDLDRLRDVCQRIAPDLWPQLGYAQIATLSEGVPAR
jgi:spore coat polysaccharide biosynthesis protein SpsF